MAVRKSKEQAIAENEKLPKALDPSIPYTMMAPQVTIDPYAKTAPLSMTQAADALMAATPKNMPGSTSVASPSTLPFKPNSVTEKLGIGDYISMSDYLMDNPEPEYWADREDEPLNPTPYIKGSAMEYALSQPIVEDPEDYSDLKGEDLAEELAYFQSLRDGGGVPPGDDGNGGIGIPDPVSYSSQYRAQMDAILRDLNLDKFKFDLNGEELYQQYKDQYLRNGRLAMMDTMGQAAGLTGGYGSTYSQNAGQQAYQGYVNDLNNVVPDVYNAAYTRWRDSITDKLRQYELLANQDNTDYSRWYDDWQRDYQNRKLAADDATARYKADLSADTDRQKVQNDYLEIMGKYYGANALDANGNPVGNTLVQNADGTYTQTNTTATTPKSTQKIGGVLETDITDAVTAKYENYIKGNGFGRAWATLAPGFTAKSLAKELAKENDWGAATEDAAREMFELLLSPDTQ